MAHMQPQHQYSPQEAPAQYQENIRPIVQQSRSYSHNSILEEQAMTSASNGSMSAPKAVRPATNNRQSVQNNGPVQRDAAGGVPSFSAAVVPPTTQAPPSYQSSQPMQQQSEVRRATPQPAQTSDDLSEEDVAQLVKDHKELRTSSIRTHTCGLLTNIFHRREVHQSQEVLFRKRRPGQAAPEQLGSPAPLTITNLA